MGLHGLVTGIALPFFYLWYLKADCPPSCGKAGLLLSFGMGITFASFHVYGKLWERNVGFIIFDKKLDIS
jgi:hypothetical protein